MRLDNCSLTLESNVSSMRMERQFGERRHRATLLMNRNDDHLLDFTFSPFSLSFPNPIDRPLRKSVSCIAERRVMNCGAGDRIGFD